MLRGKHPFCFGCVTFELPLRCLIEVCQETYSGERPELEAWDGDVVSGVWASSPGK